ncbi:ral guanine nucleotide dissociation stimulator-like [Mesocricetus auratus]|uniref:Ral guanine nucleotide dissociation stimulator-like n=1 Tax=Mesocricetus auratus TaxID=10036 RepID=A0ABM2WMV6_MESAU|nr:ral guanine nucleotide dissociation stimulator-like [Mesocricetus auratus]
MSALLVTSLQGGDSFFVFVFYCVHQKFLTTQHVLDLLFKRYTSFRPDSEEDERVKYTICTLLDYWIDKFPEEFCRIEHLPILKRVKDYLSVNMPSSDLLVRVRSLQENLLSQVASDSGASDEEASGSTATSPPRDAGMSSTPVCILRPGQRRLRRSSAPSVLTSNDDGYSGARSSLCTGAGEHKTDTRFCDPCAAGATCGSSSGLIATH